MHLGDARGKPDLMSRYSIDDDDDDDASCIIGKEHRMPCEVVDVMF